jgi:hypothetical protein
MRTDVKTDRRRDANIAKGCSLFKFKALFGSLPPGLSEIFEQASKNS